jgi:hypothetical protein
VKVSDRKALFHAISSPPSAAAARDTSSQDRQETGMSLNRSRKRRDSINYQITQLPNLTNR